MSITKLYAGVEGDPLNSSGTQIRDTVNQLIDAHVSSLKSLPTSPQTDTVYNVIGFYAGSTVGGGKLVWLPSASKSLHNGVTYYAPEAIAAWNGTQADIATLLNWTGSGNGVFVRLLDGYVTPEMAGAVGDLLTIDTASVQKAIDAGASMKVTTFLLGQYLISRSGSTIGGRHYGLLVPSFATIKGHGSDASYIKAAPNSDMDVITTNRSETRLKNVHLSGFTVDGDSASQTPTGANQSAGGNTVWLERIDKLYVDDVKTKDSGTFGFRIQQVDGFSFGTLICDHREDMSADGVHLKDVSNVVGNRVLINTRGDDGFIINAERGDCHDIAIGQLVITAPALIAAGRGMYISNTEANCISGTQRKIYNISIDSLVTYNCDDAALLLSFAEFENISINHVDRGSVNTVTFQIGSNAGAGVTGVMKNIKIKSIGLYPQRNGLEITRSRGDILNSEIDVSVTSAGNVVTGIPKTVITGINTTFRLNVDIDSGNPNPGFAIRHAPSTPLTNCRIYASFKNASTGLQINPGAADNDVYLGQTEGSATYDLDINSAANTTIIGGKLQKLLNQGTGTRFVGTRGAVARGRASVTPNASGQANIPHGLIAVPDKFNADYFGGNSIVANPDFRDGTNIRVQLRDFAGAAITTGTHQINWYAEV